MTVSSDGGIKKIQFYFACKGNLGFTNLNNWLEMKRYTFKSISHPVQTIRCRYINTCIHEIIYSLLKKNMYICVLEISMVKTFLAILVFLLYHLLGYTKTI